MTIHLVRHAHAGRRTAVVEDRDRRLDAVGLDQAKRLEAHLAGQDVQQIVSSPARRCRETVLPLADALGLDVIETEALWEGRPIANAMGLIRRLAVGRINAVVCSHGDMIPAILEELERGGVALEGHGCAKGSVWTMAVASGQIVSGRYRARP